MAMSMACAVVDWLLGLQYYVLRSLYTVQLVSAPPPVS
jgi:hypothetical protein